MLLPNVAPWGTGDARGSQTLPVLAIKLLGENTRCHLLSSCEAQLSPLFRDFHDFYPTTFSIGCLGWGDDDGCSKV